MTAPGGEPARIQNALFRPNRNLVRRHADGKMVNVARMRGSLFVCANACCCGRTDMKNSPVPLDLYHGEWMERRLRNIVHLTVGGCLGPCALANVALLLFDGQALWFHSMNDEAIVRELYDHIEAMLDADQFLPPNGTLAGHQFTASTWQPRPDGATVDDRRLWRGRQGRPDATPACELPPEAFFTGAAYECEPGAGDTSEVAPEIAQMPGRAAIPRKNGELVFEAPWQGRAFGMAVAMHAEGLFEWETFRQRLIARIAEAERSEAPFEYYRCWLAALEDVLSSGGIVSPDDAEERAREFEFGERQDVF
jgi:nitrile hydratase accessory protein